MANQNLRAFLIYGKDGVLAGGPVLRTKLPKEHRIFVEIPQNICCDVNPIVPFIASPKKLRAFVKYDKIGNVVPHSVVKRNHKPTEGNSTWLEVPIDTCCYFTTTTTTTTTSSTTTTTTTVATTTTTTSSTTTTTTTI